MSILSIAIDSDHKQAEILTIHAFSTLMTLSRYDSSFWASITSDSSFGELVSKIILTDSRQSLRSKALRFIIQYFKNGVQLQGSHAPSEPHLDLGSAAPQQICKWFWDLGFQLLPKVVSFANQCSELMEFILTLTDILQSVRRDAVDLGMMASLACQLLLKHETTEASLFLAVK